MVSPTTSTVSGLESAHSMQCPKLPVGEIYSPEEIIKAASKYVVDLDIREQAAVQLDGGYAYAERRGRARPYSGSHVPWRWSLRDLDAKRDEKQWQIVPRRQQLYEGNFNEWLSMIHLMLQQLGIWSRSMDRRRPGTRLTLEQAKRFAIDDSWAVSIMLMHVDPYFLTRLQLGSETSSGELLSRLSLAARPFRFLDLPRKLRTRIYEYMVPVGEEYDEMTRVYRRYKDHHRRVNLDWFALRRGIFATVPERLATVRRLCGVSQEFREEVSRIHYSYNFFISTISPPDCPERIAIWARLMGECNLRHLRDLKVTFWYYKGCENTFHVTYDPTVGLKANVIDVTDYDVFESDEDALDHLARIEKRSQTAAWESSGVLEFFTANTDSLRSILYRPLYQLHDAWEDEDGVCSDKRLDERNAYSIAYGECYRACPW